MSKNILAECYGDTLLVKQLKYEYFPFHSGIGEVANQMKRYFNNKRAIAIIDADKNAPSYFGRECETLETKNGIALLRHKKEDHYVIKISPAFEGFINECATQCGISLFEQDKKKFRDITKSAQLHSNGKFVNYINHIISKNPKSITTLIELIGKVQDGKYASPKNSSPKKKK